MKTFDNLKLGDIITNKFSGNAYVVIYLIPLVIVRTVLPSNPDEWSVILQIRDE